MTAYTPRTGQKCYCKRGIERDNCPNCEGSGWVIDFRAIHAKRNAVTPASQDSQTVGSGQSDNADSE